MLIAPLMGVCELVIVLVHCNYNKALLMGQTTLECLIHSELFTHLIWILLLMEYNAYANVKKNIKIKT